MKHLIRITTVAAVLAGGFLFAAEDAVTPKAGDHAKAEGAAKPRSGENTDATLTPEQRAARHKEMVAKQKAKLKELKEKKAAGTLTEKEQKQLARLEKGGRPGGANHRPAGEKKPENAEKSDSPK